MNRTVAMREDLADVAMACAHCQVEMTPHQKSGSKVRYFHCPSCRRWVSSTYADVLRGDAKFHATPAERAARTDDQFRIFKDRLERWLAALDDQDPYRVLGLAPSASLQQVKARFRELAFRSHPDRGGSAERMRALNLAYERALARTEQREAAGALVVAGSRLLPVQAS